MLDLDFSPEQEMLRQTTRDVLQRHCPLDVVRDMEDNPTGYPLSLWTQLGELDLIGLLLPPEHGGSGMTLVEGVALYQEFGRALAPIPHFVSAVLSGGVLTRSASQTLKTQWLDGLASGEAIFTPAWLEPESGYSPRGIEARAEPDGEGGFRLSGTKRHVAFAAAADRLVVLARTGDDAEAIDLFLVDPTAVGVTLRQQFTIASDTQYEVTFDDVALSGPDRIGAAGTGWATWQDVLEPALVLLAAQAVGGARYALEITTQYAKDRQQFDKPLGAFQALAHNLADAVTALDGAEQLVHEAAWAGASGRSLRSLAPMSKLFACRTFRDITAMAQQIFGGVGFTLDFDIQLYFRRAKQQQVMWSNDRSLEDAVAAALLD
ncbi:MAG TPA: acyl-CoA dehydrogenase family protein [Acidimicrobiales bacterium]|jgi:alkylation response protein AidB-like acyl-CoA dehydrogenase|nr:acyl-CoA dehydrogenase family protein [Acidimicrobiales bacterium]